MAKDEKQSSFATATLVFAVIMTGLTCYFQNVPDLVKMGYEFTGLNNVLRLFKHIFLNTVGYRLFILLLVFASGAMKVNKKKETTFLTAAAWSAAGTGIFLLPTQNMGLLYVLTCFTGLSVCGRCLLTVYHGKVVYKGV